MGGVAAPGAILGTASQPRASAAATENQVLKQLCRYSCCDGITSVFLKDRVACIAGKPAPTVDRTRF